MSTDTEKSIEIQGVKYSTILYGAKFCLDHLVDVQRIITAVLSGLEDQSAADSVGDVDLEEIDIGAFMNALSSVGDVYENLGKSDWIQLMLKNTTRAKPDGGFYMLEKDSDFNAAYQGNYLECLHALVWVLTVNYAPFLGDEKLNSLSNLRDLVGEIGAQ